MKCFWKIKNGWSWMRLAVFFAMTLLFTTNLWAKRGPAPVVPPIGVGEIEIRAPNRPKSEGMIEFWYPAQNRLLWSKRVYFSPKNPLAELDAQWNFIKSMELSEDGRQLIIFDEGGRRHTASLQRPMNWRIIVMVLAAIFAVVVIIARTVRKTRN